MTPKRETYVYKNFDQTEFIYALARIGRVSEKEICKLYGWSSVTKSWPTKISTLASQVRATLLGIGVELPRGKGGQWRISRNALKLLRENLHVLGEFKVIKERSEHENV